MSKTWVYDQSTDRVYQGAWAPVGNTAHSRLASAVSKATGSDMTGYSSGGSCFGGSVGADGSVAFRSESLNGCNDGNKGAAMLSGTSVANRVEWKIEHGDVFSARGNYLGK